MNFGLDIFLRTLASIYVAVICGRWWHMQGRNWVNVGQRISKMWNFVTFEFPYLPPISADSYHPKTKMCRSMRPTKYSSDVGTISPQETKPAKKRPKMTFWGPVGQTGSRNMAATRQNDFLTQVSYSTLNTFGGLSRTVKALPWWNLTISPL